MNQLHVVESNHMEVLAVALAEWLRQAPPATHPLETDLIIVQSLGMQRWLSMAIAQHNGICANVEFPFPNAFLEQLYHQIAGPAPQDRRFDPLPLTFGILKLLPDLIDRPEFSDLRTYLEQDAHPLKEFQLARKIADIFDQYLVFRPDMIMAWEGKKGHDRLPENTHQWQAMLWRELNARIRTPHRAAIQQDLVRHLHRSEPGSLPSRLAVFGISHLPFFHLQVLEALARHIPVHLFLMNPCRKYWTDIISDRQKLHARRNEKASLDLPDSDLHFERGNRLLASWGSQGKQFFSLIHRLDFQSTDLFIDNTTSTLLGRIQQDVLDLEDRSDPTKSLPGDTGDTPLIDISKDTTDDSIQIHICHSAMREVEVLYDQLLRLMERYEDIEPRDILVMTPDISTYAPYIHAVFGDSAGDSVRIAYSVADQNIYRENQTIEAFLQILELRDARFEATRVMALLEYACIRSRFDMTPQDVSTVETWIRKANIRWGWDGSSRIKQGLSSYHENTWRYGLDRLLLGYAMSAEEEALFCETLPSDAIEGAESALLGNLIAFSQTLHTSLTTLVAEAPLEQWQQLLADLVDRLFHNDESTFSELQMLRETISHLAESARLSEFVQAVPFEVIRYQLAETFQRSSQGTGFMTGGVTFCAMLPMRSIPAKVVWLLGMQHDAFPQEIREPGFNLMAAEPRAGDRSKREDDKYLFLEALTSARNFFSMSYTGRNQQDNAVIPPSVMVDELADYIQENFNMDPVLLTTVHPLQGFSQAYFNPADPRLLSYSKENRRAAASLQTPPQPAPFFLKPLQLPSEDQGRQCDLGQLIAFFNHPVRFIMEKRLNLFLYDSTQGPDDRENFNLDHLDRFRMSQRMLASQLKDQFDVPVDVSVDVQLDNQVNELASRQTYAFFNAAGDLPHGNIGKIVYRQLEQEVAAFARQVKQRLPSISPLSKSFDQQIGAFRFTGNIDSLYPEGRIVFRMAKCRAQDLLTVFINHLALNLIEDPEVRRRSILICKDQTWHFGPLEESHITLACYLDLYWQGLCEALPFFPRTAWAYARKRHTGSDPETALKAARQQWYGNEFVRGWSGESTDAYNKRCFGDQDPLNDRFEELALTVFEAVLANGEQQAG